MTGGFGQNTGPRIVNGVFAAGFLGYRRFDNQSFVPIGASGSAFRMLAISYRVPVVADPRSGRTAAI